MIFITSTGELLLYFIVIFFISIYIKKKKVLHDFFYVSYLLQESIPSGFETYKASSSGSVGKFD